MPTPMGTNTPITAHVWSITNGVTLPPPKKKGLQIYFVMSLDGPSFGLGPGFRTVSKFNVKHCVSCRFRIQFFDTAVPQKLPCQYMRKRAVLPDPAFAPVRQTPRTPSSLRLSAACLRSGKKPRSCEMCFLEILAMWQRRRLGPFDRKKRSKIQIGSGTVEEVRPGKVTFAMSVCCWLVTFVGTDTFRTKPAKESQPPKSMAKQVTGTNFLVCRGQYQATSCLR